jgi:hypothetical protein
MDKTNKVMKLVVDMNREELIELNRMVVHRINSMRRLENSQAVMKFMPGESVSFIDRRGFKQVGKVVKVNRTTVEVKVGMMAWKCSPSLLSSVG